MEPFLGTLDDQLSYIIKELFDIDLQGEDQDHKTDYVGVHIKRLPDHAYKFSQWTLIDFIITNLGLTPNDFIKPVPDKCLLWLHAFLNSSPSESRPGILYAILMVAKYSFNPRQEHGQAFIYIIRYLIITHDLSLLFKTDHLNGFYFYADTYYSGERNKEFEELVPSMAKCHRWLCLLQKQNILSSHRPFMMSYPL